MTSTRWIIDGDTTTGMDANTPGVEEKFSSLSLYLMGLLGPENVQDVEVYDFEQIPGNDFYNEHGPVCAQHPVFTQTRVVTVDDIIAANGERIPAYENSPDNFSAKFVIVGEKDVSIDNDALKSVHEAKRLLEQYWASSTRGLSSLTIE